MNNYHIINNIDGFMQRGYSNNPGLCNVEVIGSRYNSENGSPE